MLRLRAVLSASGRSCVSRILDRVADLCLSTSVRAMALRDRLQPASAPSVPDPDVILANILTRITPPAFTPNRDEIAASLIAESSGQTVWIQRTPAGTLAAVCGERAWK